MKDLIKNYLFVTLLIMIMLGCNEKTKTSTSNNVLLDEWKGPYGGVPAFDEMKTEDVKQAMIEGMRLRLNDIEKIAESKDEPSFENTIVQMEKSGKELSRVYSYYGILSSNLSTPNFRKIQAELAPLISDHQSKINQNESLFKKIESVYNKSIENPLEPDQQRLVEIIYNRFFMNGASLDQLKKKQYASINKRLSELYIKFSNNILNDEESYVTYLTEEELGGLSEGYIKSAAVIAIKNGEKGKYAITNTRSSMDPFLTFSTEREIRKKVWKNYYSRADNDDEFDNKSIIAEILKLRKSRVNLLGYDNYADWRLQDRMAKNPDNAMNLMMSIWPAAINRVKQEVEDMQKLANSLGDKIKIEPWDYRFYSEKVRKSKYDLNSEEVKQYLQLNKLTEAMHYVAGRLFDYKFKKVDDGSVPVFHPDVEVWEVSKKSNDKNVGLWYLDPYARQGKRSGAWASTFRGHTTFEGKTNVLATNNSNFVKPAEGESILVSWDDATTFFHEFGHALHFFSSNVRYPSLNGGVRDYTEFQSQLLERWLSTDEVIKQFLVHNKTGEPIPDQLVNKIKKASKFNQGFSTTEYLASALIDMKIHLADPENIDVAKFEIKTLNDMNMPKELPMRHRTPHFGHVFSGEGYATAYYGYMWADVLTADATEAFVEAPDGFYDKELSNKLVKYLFAPRNAIDPAEAYRLFRGRDAEIDALKRDRGF